ncbi:ABC transporter ATP-binding protein [Hypericibacter sp.]|uniref:ABC transporter ATP-binding protein n=1 Tax=Hypericibacter sp. TaxID=2705401 RepID=UPI003D6CAFCB
MKETQTGAIARPPRARPRPGREGAVAEAGDSRPMLEVVGATHAYGPVVALDNVSLTAERGEFLTILGASGSGKTTMLRVISGLERPSRIERLAIDGQDVSDKPASMRNCTTVFQNYALFPHMSVGENVGYGLKVRGVPKSEILSRALDALRLVQLADKADRRIHQLSGGERQRVALARALVTRPAILLLDEPLGALDEKLRQEMQSELVELHRTLGMTFVYITHSQEEALTMSDRVILMRKGRIEQSGSPEALFDRPVSRFAAEFMGFENIIPAVVREISSGRVIVEIGTHVISGIWTAPAEPRQGDRVLIAVRAERLMPVRQGQSGAKENLIEAAPGPRTYRGKYVDQAATTSIGTIRLRVWDRSTPVEDFDAVTWSMTDCVIIPA